MTISVRDDRLAELLKEHRELMQAIACLRQWLYELAELGIPKYDEMAWRVEELRDRLEEHFVDEERGGYLAAALNAVPQFAKQAERLHVQHGEFLGCLDRFVERAKATPPKFTRWQDAREEIEGFVARLCDHEAAENAILQAAKRQAES